MKNVTELNSKELKMINGGSDIFDLLRDIIDIIEGISEPIDFTPTL